MFLKRNTTLFSIIRRGASRCARILVSLRTHKHPEGVVVNSTPLVVFIERVKAIRCFCVRVVNTLRVSKPNNTLRVICVFILLVIILKLATNHKVAAWFDQNWFYRQNVQITNSSGSNLTQYQVSFVLQVAVF